MCQVLCALPNSTSVAQLDLIELTWWGKTWQESRRFPYRSCGSSDKAQNSLWYWICLSRESEGWTETLMTDDVCPTLMMDKKECPLQELWCEGSNAWETAGVSL
jgi:hypothetical protein